VGQNGVNNLFIVARLAQPARGHLRIAAREKESEIF
jgi:hypothetical protein